MTKKQLGHFIDNRIKSKGLNPTQIKKITNDKLQHHQIKAIISGEGYNINSLYQLSEILDFKIILK